MSKSNARFVIYIACAVALTTAVLAALLAAAGAAVGERDACRYPLASDTARGRVVVCTDHLVGERWR